jgi:hypothetical protein
MPGGKPDARFLVAQLSDERMPVLACQRDVVVGIAFSGSFELVHHREVGIAHGRIEQLQFEVHGVTPCGLMNS